MIASVTPILRHHVNDIIMFLNNLDDSLEGDRWPDNIPMAIYLYRNRRWDVKILAGGYWEVSGHLFLAKTSSLVTPPERAAIILAIAEAIAPWVEVEQLDRIRRKILRLMSLNDIVTSGVWVQPRGSLRRVTVEGVGYKAGRFVVFESGAWRDIESGRVVGSPEVGVMCTFAEGA